MSLQWQAAYEAVIGIECHIQLSTQTKAFCRCKNEYGAPPNTHVCPVCLGHPVSSLSLYRMAQNISFAWSAVALENTYAFLHAKISRNLRFGVAVWVEAFLPKKVFSMKRISKNQNSIAKASLHSFDLQVCKLPVSASLTRLFQHLEALPNIIWL